jgi:hypothetical protein
MNSIRIITTSATFLRLSCNAAITGLYREGSTLLPNVVRPPEPERGSVTIMFGRGFSTLLALIAVPVLFALFYRVRLSS